jgi:hypothetical protein
MLTLPASMFALPFSTTCLIERLPATGDTAAQPISISTIGLPRPLYVAAFPALDECRDATPRVSKEDASRARPTGLEEYIFHLSQKSALGLSLTVDD